MNEKNLEYLKDNIKYMGFGENLASALEDQLKAGPPEFQLTYTAEIHKKPFEAHLHFKRGENAEIYYFNSYEAALQRANGEKTTQKFYLNNGRGITAREAYNLLEGRAVYKELSNKAGEFYKAWVQLDFDKKDKHNNFGIKQYHENYGYDLKAALSKYAIAEMDGAEREKALVQSLQKGNLQSVAIEKEGSITKMFVEANPQYKSVTLFDSNLKRVPKESLEQHLSPGQPKEKERKEEIKQTASGDYQPKASRIPEGRKPSRSRSRNNSASL